MNNNDDYLQHYGVLGMKWGVRKAAKLNKKKQIVPSEKQVEVISLGLDMKLLEMKRRNKEKTHKLDRMRNMLKNTEN